MNVLTLLEELPKETKKKVENAKKSYNVIIREAIRFESRLSFNSGKSNSFGEDVSVRVPIKIDTGYPKDILKLEVPKEYELIALLSRIKPAIVDLAESSGIVTDFIVDYQDFEEMNKYVGAAICYACAESRDLLKMLDEYDLVKRIVEISPDILGCYKNKVDKNYFNNPENNSREIYLYWGVIGLVSSCLGVSVEDLTAVVLAHELSHAYTHLGYDIDGNRWTDEGFLYSETSVKEGLAQYYTERVLVRLRYKIPGGIGAYNKLLAKQGEDYLAHKIWIDGIEASSENIRETLIEIRNHSVGLKEFNDLLCRKVNRE